VDRRINAFFAALLLAVTAAACAPSEAETSAKVNANLTADASLVGASIEVQVVNGTVTLAGSVDSTAAKEKAVTIARGTAGVREVVDHLAIRGPAFEHGRQMNHGHATGSPGSHPGSRGAE
jgi:hypothetical protein